MVGNTEEVADAYKEAAAAGAQHLVAPVDFVHWVAYWQNRKVGRVMRTDKRRWKRQEQLRAALGIRATPQRAELVAEVVFVLLLW